MIPQIQEAGWMACETYRDSIKQVAANPELQLGFLRDDSPLIAVLETDELYQKKVEKWNGFIANIGAEKHNASKYDNRATALYVAAAVTAIAVLVLLTSAPVVAAGVGCLSLILGGLGIWQSSKREQALEKSKSAQNQSEGYLRNIAHQEVYKAQFECRNGPKVLEESAQKRKWEEWKNRNSEAIVEVIISKYSNPKKLKENESQTLQAYEAAVKALSDGDDITAEKEIEIVIGKKEIEQQHEQVIEEPKLAIDEPKVEPKVEADKTVEVKVA